MSAALTFHGPKKVGFAALGTFLILGQAPDAFRDFRLESRVLRCVVKITAPPIATAPPDSKWAHAIGGTAFLVSREASAVGPGQRLLYLVTNKHMISDWTLADGVAASYRPYIDGLFYPQISGAPVASRIHLTSPDGHPLPGRLWEYPDPTVDIALVSLPDSAFETPIPPPTTFDTSYLLPFKTIPKWVGLGDQVFALGYPQGIASVLSSAPIAKSGYLATAPGSTFAIDIKTPNRAGLPFTKRVAGAVMLVDGLITNGNSGGPILLPSDLKVRRDPATGQLQFASEQPKNVVIGIVSMSLENSGLTLAYSSDFILAGVEAFSRVQLARTEAEGLASDKSHEP